MSNSTEFTASHLGPLRAHVAGPGWTTRTLTHNGPMSNAERACVDAGLLDADGIKTWITPADLALLQVADSMADEVIASTAEPEEPEEPGAPPLAGWTARDIATHVTYGANRVQLHRVDGRTVLAVGFTEAMPHRATGRVAWIRLTANGAWTSEARVPGDDLSEPSVSQGRKPRQPVAEFLTTTDDLDALVRWLRGEA